LLADLGFWGILGLLAWVVVPVASIAIDIVPALRAGGRRVCEISDDTPLEGDFEILVPIYGDVRYLENVDYLARYGRRVVLCTTTDETRQFDDALAEIAAAHGFRIFKAHVPGRRTTPGQRSVAAPIRDLLVREALATVEATYVVCIDADTVTDQPLERLVGAFAANSLDVASVRLLPSNRNTLLARFQGHEYRLAMRMRRLYPWLVSGACHVARTSVHYQVMQRHSLFYQGNDAEFGMLAHAMGFRVGHIPFDVPTTVPDRLRPWWRQRFAWVGGEFRIYFVNLQFALEHWYFYVYGALVVTLLAPLRWVTVVQYPLVLIAVYLTYLAAFLALNWRTRDASLLLLPLYTLFGTLFLVPLCVVSYLWMAFAHDNFGRIRPDKQISPELAARSPLRIEDGIAVPGVTVSDLQRDLAAVGYDPGPVDGEFGPRTRRALIAWQSELVGRGYDLGPTGADGVFGPLTAAASRRQAPWCGVEDPAISTVDWLGSFRHRRFSAAFATQDIAHRLAA
jgi:cellulose synthase/poly-beta-1,6-N-acetylglucosamine synthase-like glycosyltransferase